jgi:hypothetical protein
MATASPEPEVLVAITEPPEETPCWDVEALGQQAKLYHARIVEHSIAATLDYWLLGRVLLRARGNFKRGRWYVWLEQHEISEDRADRARLLAAAFSSAEEFAGLTVEDARALAKRRRPPVAQKLGKKLRRRLDDLARSIERTADESEAMADERASLLAKADRLAQAIDYFRRACAATKNTR